MLARSSSLRSAVALQDSDPGDLLPQSLLDRGEVGVGVKHHMYVAPSGGTMLSVLGVVVEPQGHRDLKVSIGASSSSMFLAVR